MPTRHRRPVSSIAQAAAEAAEAARAEDLWNQLLGEVGNWLGIGSNDTRYENELHFGGSYPVSSLHDVTEFNSQDITAIASDVFGDFWQLRGNPNELNNVKTNIFYEPMVQYLQGLKDNNIKYNADDMRQYVEGLVANEMYGTSTANMSEASPYANEIIQAFTDRAGVSGTRDPSADPEEINYTVMGGGRRESVCADTACAVYTGAGMVNYLPWDMAAGKWASSNDYIIDALAGRKKGDDSYKHWDTVASGNISKVKNAQPGDWIIFGSFEAWLPINHPDRCRGEGNESCKHSMVVLDVTEKGILFGSGNMTMHAQDSFQPHGINTRFWTWENLENMSAGNQKANVYRFNPQSDKFAFFEGEVYSHKSDDESYQLKSGQIENPFRY